MKRNVGKTDQVIRVVIAIVLLVLFTETDRSLTINWLLLGVVVIILGTATVGYCPLYQLLGLSTCRPVNHLKSASKASPPIDLTR